MPTGLEDPYLSKDDVGILTKEEEQTTHQTVSSPPPVVAEPMLQAPWAAYTLHERLLDRVAERQHVLAVLNGQIIGLTAATVAVFYQEEQDHIPHLAELPSLPQEPSLRPPTMPTVEELQIPNNSMLAPSSTETTPMLAHRRSKTQEPATPEESPEEEAPPKEEDDRYSLLTMDDYLAFRLEPVLVTTRDRHVRLSSRSASKVHSRIDLGCDCHGTLVHAVDDSRHFGSRSSCKQSFGSGILSDTHADDVEARPEASELVIKAEKAIVSAA